MRRIWVLILLLLAPPAHAEDTLRDAVERAWTRQPAYQAKSARAEEFAAKRDAAQALFPEPPSLFVANRNDRLNRNDDRKQHERGSYETPVEMSEPPNDCNTKPENDEKCGVGTNKSKHEKRCDQGDSGETRSGNDAQHQENRKQQ